MKRTVVFATKVAENQARNDGFNVPQLVNREFEVTAYYDKDKENIVLRFKAHAHGDDPAHNFVQGLGDFYHNNKNIENALVVEGDTTKINCDQFVISSDGGQGAAVIMSPMA